MSERVTRGAEIAVWPDVRPCEMFGCTDQWHNYTNGEKNGICCSISIAEGDPGEGFYIAGYRDETSGLWAAWSDDPEFGDLDGAAGLVILERFLTAFRAVQAHCEELNRKTAAEALAGVDSEQGGER